MVFMGPAKDPEADSMNLITSEALGYDRSPCGTGSSAKMAVLHAKGKLKLNEEYVHESGTTGSLFRSRLVEEAKLGSIDAVVAERKGLPVRASMEECGFTWFKGHHPFEEKAT